MNRPLFVVKLGDLLLVLALAVLLVPFPGIDIFGPSKGPRLAVCMHETDESTPDHARQINALQKSEELDSPNDFQTVDNDNVKDEWAKHKDGEKPILLIIDLKTGEILHAGPWPETVEGVLAEVKNYGG